MESEIITKGLSISQYRNSIDFQQSTK